MVYPLHALTLSLLVPMALLLVCAALPADASGQTITVPEQLNRSWSHELMTYPFTPARGQCAPESVTLTGPNGAQPVQLSEVTLWPGTHTVKSAKLSFFVEKLSPQTTQSYTVAYAPEGQSAAPASDLKVTRTDGSVEVITTRFGARLLVGEKTYDAPVRTADVPGPVLALRLADGVWFGGSRLYGNTPVKSWSAKVIDDGPVFLGVETTYTYADGNTLTVSCRLAAGDYALQTAMQVKQDATDDGWEMLLNKGVAIPDGVRFVGMRSWSKLQPLTFDQKSADPACYLSPWAGDGWFPDSPTVVRLKLAGRPDELQLSIRDAGAWVAPESHPWWSDFTRWESGAPDRFWLGWRNKRIPLIPADGGVLLRMNLLAGARKWTLGNSADAKLLDDTFHNKATGAYTPMARLNDVKEMVLDWPDGGRKHPYLYLSAQDMATAGERHAAALKDAQDIEKLRALLDSLGNLDIFRICIDIAARYDTLIDSPQLSPQDRKLFKAQMAYLGYMTADPNHWSFERGMCSGNPNMTVTRIFNVGIIGFALQNNPQGKRWTQYAMEWAKYWLNTAVDEKGYWPESSHYARVSWADYIQLAIIARNTGEYDFFADPKFKAMARCYEETLTPPDPFRVAYNATPSRLTPPHPRVDAPYGRGTRGDAWGLSGLLARATAVSDPAFSRVMQWSWRESGYNEQFSHSSAGLNALYVNRDLPAERPDWHSDYFPHLGYLLRSRVGEPDENYLLFVSHYYRSADGEIWPADTGAIARWYANGCPIGGSFDRIPDITHPMLTSRVLPATEWDPAVGKSADSWYVSKTSQDAFVPLPATDYVSAGFTISEARPHGIVLPKDLPAFPKREKIGVSPFHWQRQMLLVGDDRPNGVNYLVLRDTVNGGQPTQWHFWTLSEKLGTADEAANRTAFLADKPGAKPAPLRMLTGNHFTAPGQFALDTEFYIASPTNTPRYTLRYGLTNNAYGIGNTFHEFFDLMGLQLPGDGAYFVALFPHPQGQPAPAFTTLGAGTVIKVAGTFGTDYCFLTNTAARVNADDAAFDGTAAAVLDRANGLTLQLTAPGSVRYRDYSLAAAMPASLRISPYTLTVTLPAGAPAGALTLRAPGTWTTRHPGVTLTKKAGTYTVVLPADVREVVLTAER